MNHAQFLKALAEAKAGAAAMQTKVGALGQLADRQAISAEELRQAVRQDTDMGLDFLPEEMPEDLQQAAQAFEGGQPGMGGETPVGEDAEGGGPNLLDMRQITKSENNTLLFRKKCLAYDRIMNMNI